MKKLGLIGNPLKHSFSKKYFAEKFNAEKIEGWTYDLYPLDHIDQLEILLQKEPELIGLNITIPYKEQALKFVHNLDKDAEKIGAINTISIGKNGHITGSNTDIIGFENSLVPFLGKNPNGLNAMVLGSGGASKAIHYVLGKLDIQYTQISRDPSKGISYEQLNKGIMEEHDLIINCTPLGTYPKEDEAPMIPYQFLQQKHYLYDLVYNPEKTLFLRKGMRAGAKTINGLSMLALQAEASWDIWNMAQ